MMWDEGWHMGWGWGGWFATALMMLVLWGVLAAVVVATVRWGRGGSFQEPHAPAPPHAVGPPAPGATAGGAEQVLAERYARGEIGEDEYLHRQAVLRGTAPPRG